MACAHFLFQKTLRLDILIVNLLNKYLRTVSFICHYNLNKNISPRVQFKQNILSTRNNCGQNKTYPCFLKLFLYDGLTVKGRNGYTSPSPSEQTRMLCANISCQDDSIRLSTRFKLS